MECEGENVGELNDTIEEGEIVGDCLEASNAVLSGKDSASSGIGISPGESPRSEDDSGEVNNSCLAAKPDWKNKYLVDDAPIKEFVSCSSIDRILKDFSNLYLDNLDREERQRPHHFTSSPWQYGHDNLW